MYRPQTPLSPHLAAKPQTNDRVGRIVAVTGAHAVILIDAEDASSTQKTPEIGTLL